MQPICDRVDSKDAISLRSDIYLSWQSDVKILHKLGWCSWQNMRSLTHQHCTRLLFWFWFWKGYQKKRCHPSSHSGCNHRRTTSTCGRIQRLTDLRCPSWLSWHNVVIPRGVEWWNSVKWLFQPMQGSNSHFQPQSQLSHWRAKAWAHTSPIREARHRNKRGLNIHFYAV